ncbi:MAG: hypothetical protein RSD84_09520, partial [Bacteroidales bacterium]
LHVSYTKGNKMSTEKITNVKMQMRLKTWQMQIDEQQSSGMNPTAWCKANNISPSTFFTRLKRVRNYALANSTELQNLATTPVNTLTKINPYQLCKDTYDVACESSIKLSLNGITIEVNEKSSVPQLSEILKVIGNL